MFDSNSYRPDVLARKRAYEKIINESAELLAQDIEFFYHETFSSKNKVLDIEASIGAINAVGYLDQNLGIIKTDKIPLLEKENFLSRKIYFEKTDKSLNLFACFPGKTPERMYEANSSFLDIFPVSQTLLIGNLCGLRCTL